MKYLKKFENSNSGSEFPRMEIKVKHLIEYLSKFDPEMITSLDKDG